MPMHVQRSSFHPTISFSGEHSFRIEMQADKFNVMVAVLESTVKAFFDPQRKDENSGDQRLKMEGRVQH
ncbi:hypothetical protein V6N13_088354 [Hibiscus sabdariffa]